MQGRYFHLKTDFNEKNHATVRDGISMKISDIIAESPCGMASGASEPIVFSTRVRLARNVDSFFFPGWAKEEQRKQVFEHAKDALCSSIPNLKKGALFEVQELSELDKQILVERHLISRELAQCGSGSGGIISPDCTCSVMINEEDHLRIQMIRGGFDLPSAWRAINTLDSKLEKNVHYAFSSRLGYITACPTNLGTALRASVMLHLPGLVFENLMEKVIRAVNHLGMTVRGLFGEGSDAAGHIFQISNQQTLGESEKEILNRLENVLTTVIQKEKDARQRLCESKSKMLFDKIGRAYGILLYSHELSSSEAMNHITLIRLAIDCGFISEDNRKLIDRLLIQSQPGHVSQLIKATVSPEERDIFRAEFIRKEFAEVPAPNLK